jgi:predicted nucleic acid-binding protein
VRAFLDTNILVYAQHSGAKGETAKDIVAKGGIISVLSMSWSVCCAESCAAVGGTWKTS